MAIEKEINNKEDYEKFFKKKISKPKHGLKKTLEYALDVRKFEIELYWKRATYFWAFIASSFAAYFVTINLSDFKELTIIVSLIGLVFSIGWYLANRGSKYWQKNWETHVELLEDNEIGPLFASILNPRNIKLHKITGEYPFSVSKVNQILSFNIVLIWIYLLSYSIDYNYDILENELFEKIINLIYFSVIFIWTIYLFIRNSESGLSKKFKNAVIERKDEAQLLVKKK